MKQNTRYILRTAVGLLTFLSPLSAATFFNHSVANAESSTERSSVSVANNLFAFDLYKQLESEKGNLFFSPLSIYVALNLTLPGANGETAREIESALHMKHSGPESFSALKASLSDLQTRSRAAGVRLEIANSIWVEKSYALLEPYLEQVKEYFEAGIRQVDFKHATESSRIEINRWVEEKTEDKIRDLLPEHSLTADSRVVLVNAIYFLGDWQFPFKRPSTKEGDFFPEPSSAPLRIPFMRNKADYHYAESDSLEVVELPYKDSSFVLDIILPKKGHDLKSSTGDSAELLHLLSSLTATEIVLELPKFKLEYQFSAVEKLKQLGIKSAFVYGQADFSGMSGDRELCFSDVIHKAFVDINEEGTEAAAATAIIMRVGSAMPTKQPKTIRVDRPFITLVRDTETKTILFFGRIVSPKP